MEFILCIFYNILTKCLNVLITDTHTHTVASVRLKPSIYNCILPVVVFYTRRTLSLPPFNIIQSYFDKNMVFVMWKHLNMFFYLNKTKSGLK